MSRDPLRTFVLSIFPTTSDLGLIKLSTSKNYIFGGYTTIPLRVAALLREEKSKKGVSKAGNSMYIHLFRSPPLKMVYFGAEERWAACYTASL